MSCMSFKQIKFYPALTENLVVYITGAVSARMVFILLLGCVEKGG